MSADIRGTDWFRDPAFWTTFSAFMFDKNEFAAARAEALEKAALLSLSPPDTVLDLGCGPGRYALEFARLGLRVTGVDLSAAYLERARRSARWSHLEAEFVQEDMITFLRPETYDAAVCAGLAFGYGDDPSHSTMLRNACDSLKPGGRILVETINKEAAVQSPAHRKWYRLGEDIGLAEIRCDATGNVFEEEWILLRADGERSSATVKIRLYSADELAALFDAAGFVDTRFYGSRAGAPYSAGGSRTIIVGRRPGTGPAARTTQVLDTATRVVAGRRQQSRDLGDEVLLCSLDTDEYFGLDGVGYRVWEALQVPGSASSLADSLGRQFEVERDELERDILSLLSTLLTRGLVDLVS